MVKTYCLKERKLIENVNPKIVKTSNGRKFEESRCASCGAKSLGLFNQVFLLLYYYFIII